MDEMKLIPIIIRMVQDCENNGTPPAEFFFGKTKMKHFWVWRIAVALYLLSIAWGVALLTAYLFS